MGQTSILVDKPTNQSKISPAAEVAEQADALRSGRSSLYGSVGSTPTFGTELLTEKSGVFCAQERISPVLWLPVCVVYFPDLRYARFVLATEVGSR